MEGERERGGEIEEVERRLGFRAVDVLDVIRYFVYVCLELNLERVNSVERLATKYYYCRCGIL